jgi:hypothetical protein
MSDECVNLRELFGDRFKITYDPAYDPFKVPRDKLDPWMMQIPLYPRGCVYPHGRDRLAAEVDYRAPTAKALAAIPGVTLVQDGDQEKTYTFPVGLTEQVFAILKPRKKRRPQLTPEQRARLVTRMEAVNRDRGHLQRQSIPGAAVAGVDPQGGPGSRV